MLVLANMSSSFPGLFVFGSCCHAAAALPSLASSGGPWRTLREPCTVHLRLKIHLCGVCCTHGGRATIIRAEECIYSVLGEGWSVDQMENTKIQPFQCTLACCKGVCVLFVEPGTGAFETSNWRCCPDPLHLLSFCIAANRAHGGVWSFQHLGGTILGGP